MPVNVEYWRVCIKILPQQRACQLSIFMLQKLLLHCDTAHSVITLKVGV